MTYGVKLINKITAAFVCIIAVLIFFSSTIYNFNLPSVTLGFPKQDDFILYSISGRGVLELADRYSFFTDKAGIVETIAKPGDFYRKGQLIFRIIPQYDDLDSEAVEYLEEESYEFRAPEDCVIEEIIAESGSYVRKYDKVMSVGLINTSLRAEIRMEGDVDFISQRMILNVDIKSKRLTGIPAQVMSLKREDGDLIIDVRIPPLPEPTEVSNPNAMRDMLKGILLYGGEAVDLRIENNSGLMEYVIPNSAIFRDSDGYFVFTAVRKDGAFGFDYIAKKSYVKVVLGNEFFTALSPIGFEFVNPIIINSDKVIKEGDRVKPADGADYFETR